MAESERDEFTEKMVGTMIGVCTKDKITLGNWCKRHGAHWPPSAAVCAHARDMEDFADRMIEAWEGRAAGGLSPEHAFRSGQVFGLMVRVGLKVQPEVGENGDYTDVIVIEDDAQTYRVRVLPFDADAGADAVEEVQDEQA